jgi:hypothetical protein
VGLLFWRGEFEQKSDLWLRWCDRQGQLLLTGDDQAKQERARAHAMEQRLREMEAQLRQLRGEES